MITVDDTNAGQGADRLRELIDRYVQAAAAAGACRQSPSQPPLDLGALQELGLQPPGELAVWFSWQNASTGAGGKYSDRYLTSFTPWNLTEALADYRKLVSFPREEVAGQVLGWDPQWFPIGETGGRMGRVSVWCDPSEPERGRVSVGDIEYGYHGSLSFTATASMCTMLYWWATGLEEGRITYDTQSGGWQAASKRALWPAGVLATQVVV